MKNLSMKKTKRKVELKEKVRIGQHSREEFLELQELEFEHNKLDINFRLSGNNKYYYADQCRRFIQNLYNFEPKLKDKIIEQGVSFNKYSINIGYNQFCEDYKRFNSTQELLGFVIGYNHAKEWA
tara:strand:+ start:253 stop:627 length:375 start_codon:yes stop_codon:yes gene_type:complete